MTALLLVSGVANWRGIREARELQQFQERVEVSFGVSGIAEGIARERALSVRARHGTGLAAAARSQQARVDRSIAALARTATQARDTEDVGGRLDAVRRQLFALRLRAKSMNTAGIQEGYGQTLDSLDAIERDLAAPPPTRDVATAAFADLAMRSALEAGRREQLDIGAILDPRDPASLSDASNSRWAALEQASLSSFRGAASSAQVADLTAALFSPSGLYVRRARAQLGRGELVAGSTEAERWWRQSDARLGLLAEIRADTRQAVRSTVAADLTAARTDVWRMLALSIAVVIAVLGLGLLLRRSIARSLHQLSSSAQALSAGDLGVAIPAEGHDEIAEVGKAFGAVHATNRQLVEEIHAMNEAIAAKDLTRRADASAFNGAWADVLDGMNGTMTEVARLHGAAESEVDRQKAFGLVGRRVVGGMEINDAYRECGQLLLDHVGALRAEVYEQNHVGWHRRMIVGEAAASWPAEHDFFPSSSGPPCRPDAVLAVVRAVGQSDGEPAAVLAVEFACADALDAAASGLFVDGVARLLDEALHRRSAEERQRRAQKLEATGTMAAAIAHDFNNVLGAILNNARLGELETKEEASAETFHAISGAVGRASDIVDRLLTFSRSEPPSQNDVDLVALIEEVITLLRPGLPDTIELSSTAQGLVPIVVGDATRLHQVIVNLITNSAHALGTSPGQITVIADEVWLPGDASGAVGEVAAGTYARIRVHDTGPGIPASLTRRVFDPFFTTKPKGEGTGLGLAAALTIARDHHGTLNIESVPEGGTTATLCLPVARD